MDLNRRLPLLLVLCLGGLLTAAGAQDRPREPGPPAERGRAGPAHRMPALAGVPTLDVIPGRPTARSVRLVLLSHTADESVTLRWWPESGKVSAAFDRQVPLVGREPVGVDLEGLQADTAYRYQVLRGEGSGGTSLAEGRFQTLRPAGSSFAVTLTADPHLDQNTDVSMLQKTLALARADRPDFHIDLGDTFMVDKHADRESAAAQYLAQRHYFGQLGLPLFLVLGNHDGEDRKLMREGAQSLAVWANLQRKRYFPNPEPDAFYSGNDHTDPLAGRLQDYYAWTWGDAQFIVLNPYWHAPAGRAPERWNLSLGTAQYTWLREVLATSKSRYKFVFVHQLIGGIDRQGRGGAEAVPYGEWGGSNADGSPGMAVQRPGWPESIHELLRRTGVTAVFHGHDHLYAAQERDGIAYIEVPQPGHRGTGHTQAGGDYGYRSGVVRGEGGYLRLRVNSAQCELDFVGTDGAQARVLHTLALKARIQP